RKIMPEILRIDNTKRSDAVTCLRKYYWKYERHIKTRVGSTALRYGIVWHSAMDAFYTHIAQHGWSRDGKALEAAVTAAQREWEIESRPQTFYDDYRTLNNLLQALLQYISHFAYDEGLLRIINSEVVFEIPMFIESNNESLIICEFPLDKVDDSLPVFYFTGIIDLEVEMSGATWFNDHKTTSKGISWLANTLRKSPQFMGYTYAGSQLSEFKDNPPQGFLITVHQLLARKNKQGQYGNASIDFDRIPEIYTPQDIAEWRLSLFETVSRIQKCKEVGIWPETPDNCWQFGQCPYSMLCENKQYLNPDTPLPDAYFEGEPWDVAKITKQRQERREISEPQKS